MEENKIDNRQTHGVKTLTGDPRKAVFKLAIPMIIAMSVQTLYQLIDAAWVAGKGPDALSAVAFFFPVNIFLMAIAMGVGIGGGAVISQFIGARDSKNADSAAVHTLILTAVCAIAVMALGFIFAEPVFRLMGATASLAKTLEFARIIFSGTVLLFFMMVGTSLLRSEGDTKRVMRVMLATAILNIILDPFLIYKFSLPLPNGSSVMIGLDLDVAGAAYGTVISMIVGSVICFYWLFIKKNTYLSIRFKGFTLDPKVGSAIIRIGFPTMLMQASMAVMMGLFNIILSRIGGETDVAVFRAGWGIVMVAILPILGLAAAVTAVSAAAFGSRDIGKLRAGYFYAIRFGTAVCVVTSVIVFVFAPFITRIFTWSSETAHLVDDITLMLRYMCIFFPATACGMVSSGFFQGVSKGLRSLIVTILRTLVLAVPLAAIFGLDLKLGLPGFYTGIIIANWIAGAAGLLWALIYLQELKATKQSSGDPDLSSKTGIKVETGAEA